MDLIRQILLEIEKKKTWSEALDISIEGFDNSTIHYHLQLLYEDKFIHIYGDRDTFTTLGMSHPLYKPKSLTSEGHKYLDLIREKSMWEKIKKIIKEKRKPLMTETVKQVGLLLLKEGFTNLMS